MPERERVVVIGAGMGGLAAAIRLAAAGLAVDVIEAAQGPGGKARRVPSPAGPVDAGPTVLTLRATLDELFALAGARVEDRLDLVALPRLARHFWPDGSTLDLFTDRAANVDAIRSLCGAREAEAFLRFDQLAESLRQAFEGPVIQAPKPRLWPILTATLRRPGLWPALWPGRTVESLLRRHFEDPRLIQLFGRYATYVGGRPAHSPAVLSLIWRAEAAGVWAVRQGMGGVAQALADLAEGLGVRFHYATQARRILRRDDRVVGVEIDGRATLPCSFCVFNGDPKALQDGLLGEAALQALHHVPRRKPSLSAWVWAFAARPSGLHLAHHNVFFTAWPEQEFGPIGAGRMPVSPTLYLCAQDREMGLPLPPLERFEIIMNAPAGHQPFANEEAQCRARTFPPLAAMGLAFYPEPGPDSLTTPARFSGLFPGSLGAIYGATPEGTLATFQRPLARTALAGLYLAGGGTHPGAGVPMALTSGRHAAAAVLADLTSGSRSGRMAMPGGMSMESLTTERARSR